MAEVKKKRSVRKTPGTKAEAERRKAEVAKAKVGRQKAEIAKAKNRLNRKPPKLNPAKGLDEKTQLIYKNQRMVGLMSFVAELPNFAAVLVSAILSHSIIMWLDFVDSFNNVQRSLCILLSSKKIASGQAHDLKRYEFLVSLYLSATILVGTIVLFFSSLYQVFHPAQPESFLLVAVLLKIVNVAVDVYMFAKQAKIMKQGETSIVRIEFFALRKDLIFDSVTFAVVLISYLLIDYPLSWYLSPVACLIMCIAYIIKYTYEIVKLMKERTNNMRCEVHK